MTGIRSSPSGELATIDTDSVANESTVPGATVTDALDALELMLVEVPYFDDFLGGSDTTALATTSGLFGCLGWSFYTAGGSLARPGADGDFIGAYQMTANLGTLLSSLKLGEADSGVNNSGLPLNNVDRFEWRVQPNFSTPLSGSTLVGFGLQGLTANMGSDGLYFSAAAGTPNWVAVSRRGSVSTTVNSGIPWSSTAMARLAMTRIAANSWRFFIDDVLITTFTGAPPVPTQRLAPQVQVLSSAGAAQSALIDTFGMNITR